MGKNQGVFRKSRVFRTDGILINVPRHNQNGDELFIGEKPFVNHDDVIEPVVNFFVYFVDGGGNIVPETDFSEEKLFLQVGYDHIHPERELIIYDTPGANEQRFTLEHPSVQDVPGNFYGYPGSVIVQLDQIPPDPNVGWGG